MSLRAVGMDALAAACCWDAHCFVSGTHALVTTRSPNGRYYAQSMDTVLSHSLRMQNALDMGVWRAYVLECSRTWAVLCFEHGCGAI